MTDKNNSIEIKHYKRISSSSKEKKLVTEKVQIGSATFKFLERMEHRRRKQECLLTVDMRGKVAEECKRYIHKNKTFWMDDTSYSIFVEGMKKNNLVFTVGTFEEIINGKHTYKGMRMAGIATPNAGAERASSASREEKKVNKYHVSGAAPEIIPLGYYRKRKQERLQHSTDVVLSNGDYTVEMKTRDISQCGIQVVTKQFVPFDLDSTVTVRFSGFMQENGIHLDDAKYKVLNLISTDEEYRICLLQQTTKESGTSKFIADFIDEMLGSVKGKRKLCHEDVRLTAYSQILELYYTLSTPIIPFFLSQGDGDSPRISAICKNPNNASLLNMLKDESGAFDFAGLTDESRIRNLVALAQEDGQKDPILAIYRQKDTGHPAVVCDFEFPLESSWYSFVRDYAKDEHFRIYKVLLRPLFALNPDKINSKLDRLRAKSSKYADEVMENINNIVATGALVEITSEVVNQASHATFMLDRDAIQAGRNLAEKQTPQAVGLLPDIMSFGYVEQRKEDRYQASVSAEMRVGDHQYEATTRDISVHGLCIELENPAKDLKGIAKNATVAITLPGLNKRAKPGVDLRDIPYEITCIERSSNVLLHLKRVMNQDSRAYSVFFKDLIDRNMEKLSLDLHDITTAAYSRIYSTLAAESTATIPVLIRKDAERKNEISVALPEVPSSFSEFFEISPDVFDFGFLNVSSRLARLTTRLKRNASSEILLYLYKTYDEGSGQFEILSAADFEFESAQEKQSFLDTAMQRDFCVVKVLAGAVQPPPEVEVNSIIDPLFERSSHIASRVKSEIATIIGIGEIVDVTRQELENLNNA